MKKDENNKKTKENNLADKANTAADLEKKLENIRLMLSIVVFDDRFSILLINLVICSF